MRKLVLAGVLALIALCPLRADAKPVAEISGGTIYFYNDSLTIAVRNGAVIQLSNGAVIHGSAAFIDLRADKAVIAGNATIARRGTTLTADAIALDLPAHHIALLHDDSGIERTDSSLQATRPAPEDGNGFIFPDLDDKRAYIRARRAEIVSRTSVRFRPAAFPTSTGAPPVPMYLYTFATGNGFAASALSGASFDQPYGLYASPNALTALHLRYLDAGGSAGSLALGIQQTLMDNNDGYIAGAVEVPTHAAIDEGLSGYRRLGEDGTVTLGATDFEGDHVATLGFSQAIGTLVSRLNYAIDNLGYSSAILSLRTRDRELFDGITWHTSANFGFVGQDGGVLPFAPDPQRESTIWQKGLDVFAASPLVHGPFRTTLSATVDASRTDYSYPHYSNALETDLTGSRRLSRTMTMFFGYDARWSGDIFPNNQLLFYAPSVPLPAYDGFTTARLANVDLQYVQGPYTSVRLSYRHADDFPQVNFFAGRPPNEVRADLRVRPFSNIGISFGRAYDFGWDGAHWVPGWSLSIFQ